MLGRHGGVARHRTMAGEKRWNYLNVSALVPPRTSNNQHPTSNIQRLPFAQALDVECWMLVVGCLPPSVQRCKALALARADFSPLPIGNGCPKVGRMGCAPIY